MFHLFAVDFEIVGIGVLAMVQPLTLKLSGKEMLVCNINRYNSNKKLLDAMKRMTFNANQLQGQRISKIHMQGQYILRHNIPELYKKKVITL